MSHLTYSLILLLCIGCGYVNCNLSMEENYFNEQIYDHFQTNYYEVWDQRYFILKPNHMHDTLNSTITLIFLCNQSMTRDALACIPPFFDDQRRNNQVNMILLEMRYNGKSQPYLSRNLGTDTLQYQSIQQNIADIANFVHHLRKNSIVSQNSTIIVIGQNLSGSLATWSRLKYPHLIDAAIAFNSQLTNLNFEQYNLALNKKLEEENPYCKLKLNNLIYYLNEQLREEESAKLLIEKFFFQHQIQTELFQYYIYDLIQQNLESQRDRSQFCFLLQNKTSQDVILDLRELASKEKRNLLDIPELKLNSTNTTYYNSKNTNQDKTNENSRNLNPKMANLRLECSDLGFERFTQRLWDQNESEQTMLFESIPQEAFRKICKTLFNQTYAPRLDRIQMETGGLNQTYSQTYFINDYSDVSSFAYKECEQQETNQHANDKKQNKKSKNVTKEKEQTSKNQLQCIQSNDDSVSLKDKINKIINISAQQKISSTNQKQNKSHKKKSQQEETKGKKENGQNKGKNVRNKKQSDK